MAALLNLWNQLCCLWLRGSFLKSTAALCHQQTTPGDTFSMQQEICLPISALGPTGRSFQISVSFVFSCHLIAGFIQPHASCRMKILLGYMLFTHELNWTWQRTGTRLMFAQYLVSLRIALIYVFYLPIPQSLNWFHSCRLVVRCTVRRGFLLIMWIGIMIMYSLYQYQLKTHAPKLN